MVVMDLCNEKGKPDWENLPLPALLDLACGHLSTRDVDAASRVCKRWNSALRHHRPVVYLLPLPVREPSPPPGPSTQPPAEPAPRPTATERYPPHLFNRQTTIVLPLSPARIDAADPHDLATFADLLSTYHRPNLTILFSSDARRASRAYHQSHRRSSTWRPESANEQPPDLFEPYYSLATPMTNYLQGLLTAGQATAALSLARLELRVSCMPHPASLAALALLPCLRDLSLTGGSGAVLVQEHLEAIAMLDGLTSLELAGMWHIRTRRLAAAAALPGQHMPAGGAAGNGQPPADVWGAAAAGQQQPQQAAAGDAEEGEDAQPAGLMQLAAPGAVAPAMVLPGGQAAPGGGAGGAAGEEFPEEQVMEWGDNGNGVIIRRLRVLPLEHFAGLTNLRRLRLAAETPSVKLSIHEMDELDVAGVPLSVPPDFNQKLLFDMSPLTALTELAMHGAPFVPRLATLAHLQSLARLESDRTLTVEEWQAVRALEGLTEVRLRSDVAGYVHRPAVIGGSVEVSYGGDRYGRGPRPEGGRGRLSFKLPAAARGDVAGGGGEGVGGGGTGAPGSPTPQGGNLFELAARGQAADGPQAAESVRQMLWRLAQLRVRLEPLRFLSEATSLTRLHLSWPDSSMRQWHASGWGMVRMGSGAGWAEEESRAARSEYAPWLAGLRELRDVELDCPGGELRLDSALLGCVAPSWRHLSRLVFRGGVRLGAAAAAALAPFSRLADLGLHDTLPYHPAGSSTGGAGGSSSGGSGGGHQKVVVMAAQLPAGLQRLALTNANVLAVPWVGAAAGLQRLELGPRCRWQAAPPPPGAPASAAASGSAAGGSVPPTGGRVQQGAGPWRMHGLPALSHLRLLGPPLGLAEARAVLGGCGHGLRSLTLHAAEGQAELPAALLRELSHLLPRLAHLELGLPDPRVTHAQPLQSHHHHHHHAVQPQFVQQQHNHPGLPGAGPDGWAGAAAEAGEGADPMQVDGGADHDGGGGDSTSHGAAFSALLQPLRELIAALVEVAAPPPAAGAASDGGGPRLAALRQLCLRLPAFGRAVPPPPHAGWQAQQAAAAEAAAVEARRGVLVEVLAGLGQLSRLERLQLCGEALAGGCEALEARLLARLPHCHVEVEAAARGPRAAAGEGPE